MSIAAAAQAQVRRQAFHIGSDLLARNVSVNFVSELVPMIIGFAALPYTIRGLGVPAFGVLSIAWVLLGYMTLFDLGMGRATTKLVSEVLARHEDDQLTTILATSLIVQVSTALVGTVLFGACVPLLVSRFLKIPSALIHDATVSFYLVAAALPVVLVMNLLRLVLEAAQRFDLAAMVKVPANASLFILPAIMANFGFNLPKIIIAIIGMRIVGVAGYFWMCTRALPLRASLWRWRRDVFRRLISFGGWISVSNAVAPFLQYLERFIAGALLSISAVGYYAAPSELANRILIVPGSMTNALFPAFSSLDAVGARERLQVFYERTLKYILLGVAPLLLVLGIFAQQILRIWLGADFAARGTVVLQVLLVGILLNSFGFATYALLLGTGRPDLGAKVHLFELVVHCILLYILVSRFGIVGAALAFSVRLGIDFALMTVAVLRTGAVSRSAVFSPALVRPAIAIAVLSLPLWLSRVALSSMIAQAAVVLLTAVVFVCFCWRMLLDGRDRDLIMAAAARLRISIAGVNG